MSATFARNPTISVRLQDGSLALRLAAMIAGTAILTLSSYIEVPMIPVPMTMQTFAVTLVGALYGWRLGAATIAAWLLEGALGMPVFAGGAGGLPYLAGPTAGYLLSFPLAGALVGQLVEQGWNGRAPLLAFTAMLLGNLLCLVMGGAWLALLVGPEKAVMLGVAPFVIGAIVKSALGAATLKALTRRHHPASR
jgi:biotin transport system substrate-specific component